MSSAPRQDATSSNHYICGPEQDRDTDWPTHVADQDDIIFILGHHRSGTTMLYELLERSGSFNILTAYHAVCYDALLSHAKRREQQHHKSKLNDYLVSKGLKTRLIDNVSINADMPEEYGMILYKRSGSFSITRKNIALMNEICGKVSAVGDPSKPVLLKNPWDYDRFPLIHELMPTARFVFIHRDPINILNSQIKALQKNWTGDPNPYISLLFERYARAQRNPFIKGLMRWATNPESRIQLIRHVLTRKYVRLECAYRQRIGLIPKDRYITIRYEELCANPQSTIEQIMSFIGIRPDKACDYASFVKPREARLLPSLERDRDALSRRLSLAIQARAR